MDAQEFKDKVKSTRGVTEKNMNNEGNFNFKRGGFYHWIQADENFTSFFAKRKGKTFEECKTHPTFDAAFNWIMKIFKRS